MPRISAPSNSLLFIFLCCLLSGSAWAGPPDSVRTTLPKPSIVVIPHMPMMHLSDADQDLAEESGKNMGEVRAILRAGLIRYLNQEFTSAYDFRLPMGDFVQEDDRDMELIYHSLFYFQDTIYPVKFPATFARKDSSSAKKKITGKNTKSIRPLEKKYINVSVRDEKLIPDLEDRFNADYFIFINELDIKTHSEDCINLALKIYQRELRVHYSIFDKSGKQVYGDAASSYFPSNSNDPDEIMAKNFPAISHDILESVNRLRK